MEKEYLTLSEASRRWGVHRQTAHGWIDRNRIKYERPAAGVILIPWPQEKPKPWKPWHRKIEERRENISHDKYRATKQ